MLKIFLKLCVNLPYLIIGTKSQRFSLVYYTISLDSLICVVTKLRVERPRNCGSIPVFYILYFK